MNTPDRLVVNMESGKKAIAITPDLEESVPNLKSAFKVVDSQYRMGKVITEECLKGRNGYLTWMSESLFAFETPNGEEMACSLLYDWQTLNKSEIMVVEGGFSDIGPRSSSRDLSKFTKDPSPNYLETRKAAPHSWNQITKSALIHDMLAATGQGMPVLTIFRQVPKAAYTGDERSDIRHNGNWAAEGRLIHQALLESQARIREVSGNEVDLSDVHFFGLSKGANQVIGAARTRYFHPGHDQFSARSVTAQEPVVGPKRYIPNLAFDFLFRSTAGEESDLVVPRMHWAREPLVRKEIDGHGNELRMLLEMGQACMVGMLSGLTHPTETRGDIYTLASDGIPVTIVRGANSGLNSADDLDFNGDAARTITVEAIKGQRAGHLINEHAGLVAVSAALGARRSR